MKRLTWRKLQALIVKEPDKQIVLWCEDEDWGVAAFTGISLKSVLTGFDQEDNYLNEEGMTWNQLQEFISKEVTEPNQTLDDEITIIFGQHRFYVNEFKDDALIALEDYYVVNPPGSKK